MSDSLKQWKKIWKQQARTAKGNEVTARQILRGLKVGVIPELWLEVVKTASKSDARELAIAYLLALARRQSESTATNTCRGGRVRVS